MFIYLFIFLINHIFSYAFLIFTLIVKIDGTPGKYDQNWLKNKLNLHCLSF